MKEFRQIKSIGIPLTEVHKYNKIKYNNCNIWDKLGKPSNYNEELSKTNTNTWIHLFHQVPEDHQLIITERDLKWMKEAENTGIFTGRFPLMYTDELESFVKRTENERPDFCAEVNKGNWFVRTETVILKNGVHGCGRPYSSLKSIIESLVTGTAGHTGIGNTIGNVKIYLLPYLTNLNKQKEFRVFVKNKEITAISVQHLYDENEWIENMTDFERYQLVVNIIMFYNTNIRNKISVNDFTFDLALLDNNSFYFIEPNCFGAKYAAGSALFSWTHDKDILDDSTIVEFRYTISK